MPNQMGTYTYDRDDLLRKRATAERALTTNDNLTPEQRQQLLKLIQAIDTRLATPLCVPNEADTPSTGLNLISFFFPLVGLILFCVFMDSKPVKAHAIGKWALIGFCVGIGLSVLSYVFLFALLALL